MNKVEIDTKAIYFILFFIFTHFLDRQKLKAQLLIIQGLEVFDFKKNVKSYFFLGNFLKLSSVTSALLWNLLSSFSN